MRPNARERQERIDPDALQLLERRGTVEWVLRLEPDESKRLTYRYERYVPSR